jgi:hypothetical protein
VLRRGAGAIASALVALCGFGYLAVAPEYYRIRWLRGDASDETFLRKAYSLGAFLVCGVLLAQAQRSLGRTPTIAATAAVVALFSAVIEVAQHVAGSHESYLSNAVDIAFGAAGGALGACLERALPTSYRR